MTKIEGEVVVNYKEYGDREIITSDENSTEYEANSYYQYLREEKSNNNSDYLAAFMTF